MKTSLLKTEPVRRPAVAGSFYPAEEKELSVMIAGFLSQAKEATAEGKLKILIVPHAGLEFSGQIAGWGFKQIVGKDYTRVILLGVSHRTWFDYAAIFAQGEWETSLGGVVIDRDLAKDLLDEKQKILADINPHQEEHSLEVELVFLQKVLKDFKIVPILLGQVSDETIDALGQKIAENLDGKTLLVVSSDLSHYPPWSVANQVDDLTIKAILTGSKDQFDKTIGELEAASYPGVETCACGQQAISTALKVAEILQIKNFVKIKYANSGDLPGNDKERVVGYGAIGVWQSEKETTSFLDEEAKKEALVITRQTLESYLNQGKIPQIDLQNKSLKEKLGAFVTLRKEGELRGCIGSFEPSEPLYKVIQEMAIAAATEDTRFLPVTLQELKEIKIEISVMTPKKQIDNWQKIQLGKQGVVVRKGRQSGTFLPQVATETGWSKEEFLSQLCSQKAGLPPDCYLDPSVKLFIFEAQVFEEK